MYDNCSNIDIDNALVANHYLLEEYDNRESEKIYIVPAGLNVDPYNDYPYENAAISRRNTNIYEKICTDKVHPANSGYFKIADVLYSYIKFFAELDEE